MIQPENSKDSFHSIESVEFFRDPAAFDFLTESVVPKWPKDKRFLAWVCSADFTGDSYSLVTQLNRELGAHAQLSVLATGDKDTLLKTAENGVFSKQSLSTIPKALHQGNLAMGTGEISQWFKFSESVRSRISFRTHDLTEPTFPGEEVFDLIFCRGVFAQLRSASDRSKLGKKLCRSIKKGGWLILSSQDDFMDGDDWEVVEPQVLRKL